MWCKHQCTWCYAQYKSCGGKTYYLAAAKSAKLLHSTECPCNCCVVVTVQRGERGQCIAQVKLKEVLSNVFHRESFRPGQLEALLPVAHGRDVFVHMPTGGGKSVCMYLVALALSSEAMGIVVSPLVGLVEQQVSGSQAIIIVALYIKIDDRSHSLKLLECQQSMGTILVT